MNPIKTYVVLALILLPNLILARELKYVDANVLNVREGKGTNFKIIEKVVKGDSVYVLNSEDGWSKIELSNGLTGFASSKYLVINKPIPKGKSSSDDGFLINSIIFFGILFFIIYKTWRFLKSIFGIGNSDTKVKKHSTTSIPKTQQDYYFLIQENGSVYLNKEGSTYKKKVFGNLDYAIDCDLENPLDSSSRYLVVTEKGEVLIRNLNSTASKVIFRPFKTYGSAIKANFQDDKSFLFLTELGTYKGYFNSTKIEKKG